MNRIVLGLTLALLAGQARADITLKLTEVITSPPRTALLESMIARFEAANPGVKVELTSLPWDQAFERLTTMVMGGHAPDVVEMPDRWLALWAENGQLESLKPWMDDWDETGDLTDRALEFGSVVGNMPYMLPHGFYVRALFWNRKLFEEAGIEGPPRTMADFMEAARKISALGRGRFGYCLRGGPGAVHGYMTMIASQSGSNAWFDEDGRSMLERPEAVAGVQFLVDMYKNGYVPKESVGWGFDEVVAAFHSGTCAMLDQDRDALVAVARNMAAADFAVAPMPLGPSGRSFPIIGYAGWSMLAASRHKEAAWKLIAALSSRQENLEWSKFLGLLPTHKSADQDPFFATGQYAGWLTELNDPRWVLTPLPTHLEEFGFFAEVLAVQGGQEALLGRRTAADVVAEWARYLSHGHRKWLAAR